MPGRPIFHFSFYILHFSSPMPTPRVLFFGYSEVGYATLELLLARGVAIAGVFTHTDDGHETQWFRSVPKLAAERGLPVFTPDSLKDPVWEEKIRARRPDVILSMYYRNMIPTRLLNLAPLGAFNMHGSYLPRYRGRAPLNWAIIHGEDHTGVSLHVMVKEADAGDLVDQEKVLIGPEERVSTVLPRVREAAVRVLNRQLDALLAGHAPRTPQDHTLANYFGKRTPEDGRIDWNQPARTVFNLIRAVTKPFPGAFTDVSINGQTARLVVWWARVLPDGQGTHPPGTVIKLDPLTVCCANSTFLELIEYEWLNQITPANSGVGPTLQVGTKL
jgi:methionyl-tRNA formyltransferase